MCRKDEEYIRKKGVHPVIYHFVYPEFEFFLRNQEDGAIVGQKPCTTVRRRIGVGSSIENGTCYAWNRRKWDSSQEKLHWDWNYGRI